MKDPASGVEVKYKKRVGSSRKYFQNKELVDWLMKDDAESRAEAVQVPFSPHDSDFN